MHLLDAKRMIDNFFTSLLFYTKRDYFAIICTALKIEQKSVRYLPIILIYNK